MGAPLSGQLACPSGMWCLPSPTWISLSLSTCPPRSPCLLPPTHTRVGRGLLGLLSGVGSAFGPSLLHCCPAAGCPCLLQVLRVPSPQVGWHLVLASGGACLSPACRALGLSGPGGPLGPFLPGVQGAVVLCGEAEWLSGGMRGRARGSSG